MEFENLLYLQGFAGNFEVGIESGDRAKLNLGHPELQKGTGQNLIRDTTDAYRGRSKIKFYYVPDTARQTVCIRRVSGMSG